MAYKKTLFGFLLVLLVSCTPAPTPLTGSAEIIGKPRPAIAVNEVQVYETYPYAYEVIAIVRAKAGEQSVQHGVETRVLDELKAEAAKVGANGIVLKSLGKTSEPGESYQVVTAEAIYVLKK